MHIDTIAIEQTKRISGQLATGVSPATQKQHDYPRHTHLHPQHMPSQQGVWRHDRFDQ